MNFELFIAYRHLTRRRKTGFISIISLITVVGIAIGVAALIIVLSVMTGFDNELKRKIVSVQPHLRIEKIDGIEDAAGDIQKILAHKIPTLKSVARIIEKQAILRSNHGAQGIVIMGIDTQNEDLSFYQKNLVSGTLGFQDSVYSETKRSWWFKKTTQQSSVSSIMIGDILANRLNVQVGDVIYLVTPEPEKRNLLLPLPLNVKTWPVMVRGVFHVGMVDADTQLALLNLETAQKFYNMNGRVMGLDLRFEKVDEAEKWKWVLAGDFSNQYFLRSWYDMNQHFFQALKVEKTLLSILLSLIVVVAALNIISTLIMVSMEKTKDIGVLRALGATKGAIRRIFLIEGINYGFWGLVIGIGLGLMGSFHINDVSNFIRDTFGFEVFPKDIYIFDKIPAEVQSGDVIMVAFFAFLIAVFAAFYPAHRAANLDPVEALRYE